jgi:hypothetical protein
VSAIVTRVNGVSSACCGAPVWRAPLGPEFCGACLEPLPGWHQENERRILPCGCQLTWSRGQWHPQLTCRAHWRRDEHVLEVPGVACRSHRHEAREVPQ